MNQFLVREEEEKEKNQRVQYSIGGKDTGGSERKEGS
jgi:hypothetical protein